MCEGDDKRTACFFRARQVADDAALVTGVWKYRHMLSSAALADPMPTQGCHPPVTPPGVYDNAWPGDVELLQRLMRPARNRAQAGAPSGRRPDAIGPVAIAGSVAGTLLLAAFVTLLMHETPGAEAHIARPPLQVRVAGALAREGLNGLSAEAAGDAKVVVSGLVNSHREIERAHAVLREFGETAVVNRYASADDLARSISDALADASLNVRYEGSGVFLVQGAVRDVDALHSIVGRIGSDIGPLVKRIDIDVKQLPPAERAHLDAMLMSPDLQYVQTPDGTKHLVVVSTAASDSSADR